MDREDALTNHDGGVVVVVWRVVESYLSHDYDAVKELPLLVLFPGNKDQVNSDNSRLMMTTNDDINSEFCQNLS